MFNDLRFLLRSLFRRRPSRAPQSAAEAAALGRRPPTRPWPRADSRAPPSPRNAESSRTRPGKEQQPPGISPLESASASPQHRSFPHSILRSFRWRETPGCDRTVARQRCSPPLRGSSPKRPRASSSLRRFPSAAGLIRDGGCVCRHPGSRCGRPTCRAT